MAYGRVAGRFFDRDHGDDGRLVEGETTGNPSIVINETAMRKLGFDSPSQAVGKIVTWNRRRWSANPNPGTLGPSEIIGVSPDFGSGHPKRRAPADTLRGSGLFFGAECSA